MIDQVQVRYELRTLKKLKLKTKEKINATKQQFFA